MLRRNFELIQIKIGFFYEFYKLLKNWAKDPVLYRSKMRLLDSNDFSRAISDAHLSLS